MLLQDRSGDTNLIHAAKAGHKSIVEALLKKYADVDMTGKVLSDVEKRLEWYILAYGFLTIIIKQERKTALYWAVEKNHVSVVKSLLNSDPNLEISTKVKSDIPSKTVGAFPTDKTNYYYYRMAIHRYWEPFVIGI